MSKKVIHKGDKEEKPEPLSNEEILKLKKERDKNIQAVLERKVFLADQYVEPHRKPGKRVKEEDLEIVLNDAPVMHEMCMVGRGEFNTAHAIAHTQISTDPLRFFVNAEGQIYINPVIMSNDKELATLKEGCMSYPEEPLKTVIRYKTITVKYRTVGHKADKNTGESLGHHFLTKEVTTKLSGMESQIMQHECQHLNGSDIYQPDTSASKAFGEDKDEVKLDKKD